MGLRRGSSVRNACMYFLLLLLFAACGKDKQPALFIVKKSSETGLHFTNTLSPTDKFNVFHYMYYYNGAGVCAGDFNNDGLTDLFFAANQGNNKMFLNEGKLHFKDVTEEAKIPQDNAWSTGVSVVDINNDGLLDIYVCRVGKYEILNSKNQFLICKGIDKNGVPFYADEAAAMKLDFTGFSTQAAFLDYDLDGDLDMYLLNHSLHQNGTYGPRQILLGKKNATSGDRFYKNTDGKFKDITDSTGIHSSVIGYGLGIVVSDMNMDGYPDIYIGNDFHENDYLYINQRNGTFKDERENLLTHTSQYTMGVDAADLTNDGLPEIVTSDMLAYDPYILKRSEGSDQYDVQHIKQQYGYAKQETRNSLQFNRGNGYYSETGLYSGMAATDWSWSSLIFDFDNDGRKDIFIANGIPKRLNDIDYINYVSNDEVQVKIRMNNVGEKDMALIEKFPEIKVPNKFYHNDGALKFTDMQAAIENDKGNYSNGALYADLDNDGDLDIVVNTIDEPALLYENTNSTKGAGNFIALKLKGNTQNVNAIGAKVLVFCDDSVRTYQKHTVHGFLSSIETPMHFSVKGNKIDSVCLIWPDNTYEKINWQADTNKIATKTYKPGLPVFDYNSLKRFNALHTKKMYDITARTQLLFKHIEGDFQEFNREPLIPHMLSTEGPALAVADINSDGLDDVFIGSSKRNRAVVYTQQSNGTFTLTSQPSLVLDSVYEDVDACWADVNNDKIPDLVVASGGNEYQHKDVHLMPRIYINDGKGNLQKVENAFTDIFLTASSVAASDFNGDGFTDLFFGARTIPWQYGNTPQSYLLQNDGKGHFKNVTPQVAKGLSQAGLVTNAKWFDLDKDGDEDLLVSLEWDGICAFINDKGSFTKKYLTTKKGWWNFSLPCDVDNDGDIDIIAGNLGLNSRLQASEKEPMQLYFNDFDNNGAKEQILTFYLQGRQIPFATKDELEKKMPGLKKQFLYAEDFAKASLTDIFGKQKLESALKLSADYFSNAVLINDGKQNYTLQALPWQAQLSTYRDAAITDANNDNLPDILLTGNYFENNTQLGPYDADYGTILINKGKGNFVAETLNGVAVKGQVRHIRKLSIANKEAYILSRNNDSTMILSY